MGPVKGYRLCWHLQTDPLPSTGVVFDGAALGPRFFGMMRDRAGDVAVTTDFRIGRLDAI